MTLVDTSAWIAFFRDRGPVAAIVARTLEDDEAAPLPPDVAVGGGIERLAAPVGRHHPHLAEGDGGERGEDEVDPAHQRHPAVAEPEALRREVDRHERRGAGRVESDGGALEAEEV